MTQENVEFLARLFAGVDSALPSLVEQPFDPDVEWLEDPERTDGRAYRAQEGVRASWIEELVDCGDDERSARGPAGPGRSR